MSGDKVSNEPRTEAGRRHLADLYRSQHPWTETDRPYAVEAIRDIEAEARFAALAEVEGLIVDAPCRHAADFGAGPDVDPGPCLTEIGGLIAAIQALQEKSA